MQSLWIFAIQRTKWWIMIWKSWHEVYEFEWESFRSYSANVSISNAYNYWNLLVVLLNNKCNSKSKHLLALTFLITQAYNTYHLARMKYESKVCSNSKTESKSRWYSSIYNTDEYVFWPQNSNICKTIHTPVL